jgi:hypothetical protein
MTKTRRKIEGGLKVKIALEGLREQATVNDLAQRYEVHPNPSGRIWTRPIATGFARPGVYRKPDRPNDNELEAMPRIDALFTARPFFGAADRADAERGVPIDRKRMRRLMRRMGIEALDRSRAPAIGAGAQDLSQPLARPDDRSAEPGDFDAWRIGKTTRIPLIVRAPHRTLRCAPAAPNLSSAIAKRSTPAWFPHLCRAARIERSRKDYSTVTDFARLRG